MKPSSARRLPLAVARAVPLFLASCLLFGCGAAGGAGADRRVPSGGDSGPLPQQDPDFMRVGALLPPDAALKPSGPEDKPKDVETKTVEDPNAPFAEQSRPGPKKPVDDVSSPKPEELREPTGKIEGAVVESQSTISEAEVRAAVLERRASFRRCYDLGAAAAPGFSGSVKVRVSVSPAGNVANVSLISSTTKNQQVDACVTEEVERLMFPSNGGGAVIAFPIEFGG